MILQRFASYAMLSMVLNSLDASGTGSSMTNFKILVFIPLILRKQDDVIILVGVYVDDLLIASNSDAAISQLKDDLSQQFQLRDLGLLHYFLGMHFTQAKKEGKTEITITQGKYIQDLLKRFGMENCKPTTTPMDP